MKILENTTFGYNKINIIDNFSLTVPDQGITLMSGANGAGKTTVIELILGINKPQKDSWVNKQINWSYVPDSSKDLFQGISLQAYFAYIAKLCRIDLNQVLAKVTILQKQLDLSSDLNSQNIATLSLGQRKKVLLIGALIQPSDALIFDEPFSGLDKDSVVALKKIINELSAKKPVLLVSHENITDLNIVDTIKIETKKA